MPKHPGMHRHSYIFALLFIVSFAANPSSALSQIGHYVVIMPTHISEGEYAGDYDLKAAKVQGDGVVSWGNLAPKPISEMPVREFGAAAAPDGKDGLYLAYTIEHTDEENLGDRDIILRRIDKDGNDVWDNPETGPMLLLAQSSHFEENPRVVRVGDGLVVFYEVRYSDAEHEGDIDVAAIRINADGAPSWENATWVANTPAVERIAGVYSDGYGNAIALIQKRNSDAENPSHDLELVQVAQDGTAGWKAENSPSRTVAGSPHDERNAALIPDGNGGAYIAYEIRYVSGSRNNDIDIIAQHINGDGHRSWIDPTSPPIVSSNSRALEQNPSIARDSLGLIVAFQMEFQPGSAETETESLKMIGTQRLDSHGKAIWNSGERAQVLLARNRVVHNPIVLTDNSGDAFVLMTGTDSVTGDNDVFIQKLNRDGARQWGQKGYAIPAFNGPMPEDDPTGFTDKYGGIVVFAVQQPTYRVDPSTSKDSTIVAQRLNSRGERSWGTGTETNLTVTRGEIGDHLPTVVQSR